MAEAAVSVVIVGTMLVAALNTVAAARMTEYKVARRTQGLLMAEQLLTEILQQDYADPEIDEDDFGLAAGKVGDGSRALWTDADDYDGWAKAPQRRDGTLLPGLDSWIRSVSVVWLDPANLSNTVGSNMGVKQITVTVSFNGVPVASLSALRTSAWKPARPSERKIFMLTE